ncbi:MAG: AAA domain-containing protein [Planctomycetota bacterium]
MFEGWDAGPARSRVARPLRGAATPRPCTRAAPVASTAAGSASSASSSRASTPCSTPRTGTCSRPCSDRAEAPDAARHALGLARGRELGFTDAQCEALARGVATEACTLIHGPPGTGKTRVLAEIALFLAERRCRLFLSAFTHRAVDNVLATLRELSRDLPLYKVGRLDDDLRRLGVRPVRALERLALPPGGAIVAGTSFAARRFTKDRRFHFVLIDEAGQVPVVHGAIAMTQARRAILVGDPCQLPPVQKGGSFDAELEASIFAWLARRRPAVLLDRSFRMNAELCAPISAAYYGGRLEASGPSARRRLRLQPGGPLRELLDPEVPLVWARVDHLGRRRRSAEEARLVADLVQVLLHHHGLPPGELAVLTPFRTQIRQIRHELQRLDLWRPDLVVDTVERMQGQEREVVLISFAGSDRDDLARQAGFYFEPGRWNVSLTRARSKCILIGSRHALRARPRDLDQLLAVSRFKGIAARIPVVDLTSRYGGGSAFA